MTPKDKAKELIDNHLSIYFKNGTATDKAICLGYAKLSALITVAEIMQTDAVNYEHDEDFWYQVNQELKKL